MSYTAVPAGIGPSIFDAMRTLAVDVGGSHVKASVLDPEGRLLHREERLDTPRGLTPARLVKMIAQLAEEMPDFDRISVGFPGVIRRGVVRTAANLGTERFAGFNLAAAVEKALGKPTRVCNDADVQGYAAVSGKGLEMVITLGTGFGSSIFVDGRLGVHLELAHHCFHGDETYEDLLGDAALHRLGNKAWSKELVRAISTLRALTDFDHLYIGGGNARLVRFKLPADVSVVDNIAGIVGGVRLWHDAPRTLRRRVAARPKR
jgi:polyphosphate glucokinase